MAYNLKNLSNIVLTDDSMEELRRLAYTDSLTGVFNRNMLEKLRSTLEEQTLFISMVDVDGLKHVNDIFGHDHGDLLIKTVADKLKKHFAIVIRLGGDEFLCVHYDSPSKDTVTDIQQKASIGTVVKIARESLSHAMTRADQKMYEFKAIRNGAYLSVAPYI